MDRAVVDIAVRQHGVVSRAQALDAGANDRAISHRIATGRWDRCLPGIYRVSGSHDGHMQRLWVAHLAAGPHSVISHQAAAALFSMTGFPRGDVVLTLPHPEHARLPGATVHQISDLEAQWVWQLNGLPVTTAARTIVDLAAVTSKARLEVVLDDALAATRITLAALAACLYAILRPGKPGLHKLVSLLDERGPGHVPPASALERLLFQALAAAGLPQPQRQFPLPGRGAVTGRVDAAYPDAKLIVEADGRRWHSRRADFSRDRARDNEAARAGWLTLRFTWEELAENPTDVADTVAVVRAERLLQLSRQ